MLEDVLQPLLDYYLWPSGCLVGRMFLWVLRMLFQNLQNFKGGHTT